MTFTNMAVDINGSDIPVPAIDDVEGWRDCLDVWMKTARETAERVFHTHGELRAGFQLMTVSNARTFEIHSLMPAGMTKDETVFVVRRYVRKVKPVALIHLVEMWWLHKEGPDIRMELPPSGTLADHPERREALWISLETARDDLPQRVHLAEIIRPAKGKPQLLPWTDRSDMDLTGRFTHLLREPPPTVDA